MVVVWPGADQKSSQFCNPATTFWGFLHENARVLTKTLVYTTSYNAPPPGGARGAHGAPGASGGPPMGPQGPPGPRGPRGINFGDFWKKSFSDPASFLGNPQKSGGWLAKTARFLVRPRPNHYHGWIRGEILAYGVVSDLDLVSWGSGWWPNWCRKAGLASPAPNVHRTLAKSCRTLAKSWTRVCGRRPLVSVCTRKLFFGPDFGHFPRFLNVFWVIFRSKMVDFELGPECRPELFEVYLGILPGPFLGPAWAQSGPRRDPGTLGPGPWDQGTGIPGTGGTLGPWDPAEHIMVIQMSCSKMASYNHVQN